MSEQEPSFETREFLVVQACRRCEQVVYMNAGVFTLLEDPADGMRRYPEGMKLVLKRDLRSNMYAEESNEYSTFVEHELDALKKAGVLVEIPAQQQEPT